MKLLNEIVDDCFETMKDTLLSVKDESEEEFRNQKEQYRAYGLLLSACIKTNKNEKVWMKFVQCAKFSIEYSGSGYKEKV